MAALMLDSVSGWLDQVDAVCHQVFDPMHLSGIGTYWRVVALAIACNFMIVKLSPLISKLLFPKAYGRLGARDKKSWDVCVLGLIHSAFDSAYILAYLFDGGLSQDKMNARNEQFEQLLAVTQGYYIWDLVVCIADFSIYGPMYAIHALLGVIGLFILMSGQLEFYAIPYLIPELSTVFLNIRHLLKHAGYSSTLIYKANFLVFVVTYIAIRVGYENYHSFQLIKAVYAGEVGNAYYPFAVYLSATGIVLMVLNVIWLKQILKAAYYTIFKSVPAEEKAKKSQ
ncbi:hypothetical protein GGI12_002065 [Dipsacomyces acuminosporus]|nr:hypothetical protein GGI12_002065 [Dipsacomyces acuminosporus]